MSRKLLITDDALIIRTIIRDTAVEAGWDVVGEATNGQEAIDSYEKLQPDLVTLDIVMPEFDGLHGLRGIRGLNPNAKVVMVSALNQKEMLKEAFKLGATDFVCKPFDRSHLMETLDRVGTSSAAV
jgi:two-component system chemotaxis response regulator CheY